MNLPEFDRAVLGRALTQIAQLMGTHSKTDQTDQTDQRIENAWEFGAPLGQKLTGPHPKLTSGTAQRPNPALQVVGMATDSALARPSHGALRP
jgi:hypothetical protein